MTDAPNIILIVLDTMRKDSLATYGGKAVTPNLDALVGESVVYPNAVAPSPWTLPSHASLFTGLYPSQHGVHETRERKLPRLFGLMSQVEEKTIGEYLGERGYNTIGYSANANIAPSSGFDTAFNSFTYFDPNHPSEAEKQAVERGLRYGKTREEAASNLLRRGKLLELCSLYRMGRQMVKSERLRNYPLLKGGDRICESIVESSFEEPFFLFVNLFEMHEPYTNSEPTAMMDLFGKRKLTAPLLEQMKRRYLEEATVVDGFIGMLTKYLKQCGAYEGSMVIITSDHGQGLKERGYFGHGVYLHPEIVEIPLIVKHPKNLRPRPGAGYQSLTRVPELIKDSLVGITDGGTLSTDFAISESCGISNSIDSLRDVPDFEGKRSAFDRPRKAIYRGGYRLVVDGESGHVEELSKGTSQLPPSENRAVVEGMLGALSPFAEPGFSIPQ